MNYFELFDLPVSFYPPLDQVRKKYFELSRLSHPDYFAGAGEAEQSDVLQQSAEINKAFKILTNPDATLGYILELKGWLPTQEKQSVLPSDFLMEVLELNEEADNLKEKPDNEGHRQLNNRVKEMEENMYAPVKNIMENYTDNPFSKEELLPVRDYYLKKKYLQRISEALNGML